MHPHSFSTRWVVRGFRVAAGLLLVFASLRSGAQELFYQGDAYRISADVRIIQTSDDLSALGSGTLKFTQEAGFYTDFTFQDMVTGAYLGINAWSAMFPNFDYVISAMDPDGDGVFPMRQANGDIVFQEVVGSPSYVHLITYDPGNGVQKILGVEFPQDSKRVTLNQGTQGGFLIDESNGNGTRIAAFDRSGKLKKEWSSASYTFMGIPIVNSLPDELYIISGKVDTSTQPAQTKIVTAKIDSKNSTTTSTVWNDLPEWVAQIAQHAEIKKAQQSLSTMDFYLSLGVPQNTVNGGILLENVKRAKDRAPRINSATGFVVGWLNSELTTARELDFPELSENDSYRKLRVAAGRGNEIVIPARMDDPSGGASFLVLIRLDLDTGNVEETVRFKLDEELTMTAIEFRSGRLFALLRGPAQNYLLKCDPLNLTDLEIKQVVNINSRVHFNLPDDITQPLDAIWPDSGTSDHFVAAFDDNLDDTLCLDFEPIVPTTLEAFATTVTDQGAITGTPTTVFVEQTDPQWADLLQPNTRPLTISQGDLIVTQTCEALRLTGEPDGTGKLRVRFPTEVGYTYALAVSTDAASFAQPTSVESIPGTGSEVIRLFDQTEDKQFFLVTATPAQ